MQVGEEVTFRNDDSQRHQLAAGTPEGVGDVGDRRLLGEGELVIRRHPSAGTFAYVCTLHPSEMRFTLTVVE